MGIKCIYHTSDLDGKCSAAVVMYAHKSTHNVGLIPINYGWQFPWDSISSKDTVFMVDFAIQPFEQMIKLKHHCKKLIWIDHHKTSIMAYAAVFDGHLDGKQRVGIGACLLTWEYFFPEQPIPQAVRLLAEYDVWNHRNSLTLPFQYGLRSLPNTPTDPIWQRLFEDSSELVKSICKDGSAILRYIKRDNQIKAKTLWHRTELDGLQLCAANFGPANSQLLDVIWDPKKFDAMCLYYWAPKKDSWTVSLFTDREDVDVSAVAATHGGGGHKSAAGFQTRTLPFELRKREQ